MAAILALAGVLALAVAIVATAALLRPPSYLRHRAVSVTRPREQRLRGTAAVAFIAGVTLLTLLVVAGCAESSAEVNAPEAWETKAADPAFARRAETALTTAPQPEPGWRVGVVTAEADKGRTVAALTPDGMVSIRPAWSDYCDDRKDWPDDEFELTISVGDLITWAGDGRTAHRVCYGDLRVLRKAVA